MKYIGIDVGGTNLKAGIVDENGNVLATTKMKIAQIADQDELARTMADMTRELAQAACVPMEEIASVGVGVPGTVEIHSGLLLYSCNLPLRNVPLRRLFHKHLRMPLYIENDANCAALAEYLVGAGRGTKRFLMVTLGTGIGGGIIHNGKIFHGSNGMAGEVGHMSIAYNGHPCPCGRNGCWEQYASASALKRMTREAMLRHPESILARVVAENNGVVSGQSAFIAARSGDPVGQQVCRDYIGYLSEGIVNLINIFQPDALAIGGGVSNEADEYLLIPVQQQAAKETIPCSREKMTRIVRAELGNQAGIIGAALLGKKRRSM